MLGGTAAAAEFPPFARQRVVTGNITLTAADYNSIIHVDGTGGPFVVTLPAPTLFAPGAFVMLQGSVMSYTLTPIAGITINDSAASLVVTTALLLTRLIAENSTNWSLV